MPRIPIILLSLLGCMLTVNGAWLQWTVFSTECTKSCGGGVRIRTRCCDKSGNCAGKTFDTKPCNEQICPVNGGWGDWGSYTNCDKTCDGGQTSRSRSCNNPSPAHKGAQCVGPRQETRACNTNRCPQVCIQKTTRGKCCVFPFTYGKKTLTGCYNGWCSLTAKYVGKWGNCQKNGQWTYWGAYSKCSRSCGGGTKIRTRTCTNKKYCTGPSQQTTTCNADECPIDKDIGGKQNPGKNCKDIKENRSKSKASGIYWIDVGGQNLEVYCDMDTDGGGWTLVWSYTFTDFKNFWKGSNAVTPRPNWDTQKNSGTVRTSTTPPISETDYNAMNFNLWKEIGHQFMVKSNINNWISCRENGGSLVDWKNGDIICNVVKNVAGKCGNVAPNKIQLTVHDSYGDHSTGPNLYSTQVRSRLKTYYYFEDSTAGVNWPTHDPCGKNQLSYIKSDNPHGNIYIR